MILAAKPAPFFTRRDLHRESRNVETAICSSKRSGKDAVKERGIHTFNDR